MKTTFRIALVFVILAMTVGCQQNPSDADVKVDLQIEPSPPKVGMARVTLDVSDAGGEPIKDATIKLEGNMNHAGMKPVFADAREEKPGRYKADLEFTMGGDWFILVEGKRKDGKTFKKKIDVKGVGVD
jgi:hypothetical protein